ncbi:MAG: hypothetical protein HYZ51_01460 [Candidatus Doudnabacteria bacterium]|nr:hypothetical protein [Candidatus Doudnabacteria bacterium]
MSALRDIRWFMPIKLLAGRKNAIINQTKPIFMEPLLDWIATLVLIAGLQITFRAIFLNASYVIEAVKRTSVSKILKNAILSILGLLIVYRQLFLLTNNTDSWASTLLIWLILFEAINDLFLIFYKEQRIKFLLYLDGRWPYLLKSFLGLELLFFCYLLLLVLKPILALF